MQWVLLEALIETSHRKGDERLHYLYIISNKLDLLKVLIRLAKETLCYFPVGGTKGLARFALNFLTLKYHLC